MIWPFKKRVRGPSKFQLGNRALVAKRYLQAISLLEEHAEECPEDYAKSHTRIAECMRRSNILSRPMEVHSGITLVSQGNRQGAELHYRLAIARDPDYTPALLELAQLLPAKSAEKLGLLEHAAKVSPSYLGLIELGDYYRSVTGELELALKTYIAANRRNSRDKAAYMKLQDVCKRLGREEEAKQWSVAWKSARQTKKQFSAPQSD